MTSLDDLVRGIGRLGLTDVISDVPENLLSPVPEKLLPSDITKLLASDAASNQLATLQALHVIFRHRTVVVQDGIDGITLGSEVAEYIERAILPVLSVVPLEQDTTDYHLLRVRGELGVDVLGSISTQQGLGYIPLSTEVLLAIVAFTNTRDPWTTATSEEAARWVLLDHFYTEWEDSDEDHHDFVKFVRDAVLTGCLRPLFSQSRPAAVTASGRRAAFVEPARYDNASAEAEARKPWKYSHRYAITIFEWVLHHSTERLLREYWHLCTPVLLALVDEPQMEFKIRGLVALRKFLIMCPPDLMRQTGLAEVFEDAVFPAVLSLPSLTPEDESLAILGAAYPVLFALAGIDDDLARELPPGMHTFTEAQQKLLDKIVREGILVGYHHASEHVRLVELFCDQLCCMVNGMGILTIKHLKNLIPMVSEIMTEPFGTNYPPALRASIRLLQAILSTCWPRIPHYCNDIVKPLMICWLNVEEEDAFPEGGPSAAELKGELVKTADMLAAVMRALNLDLRTRVSPLIQADPQLGTLFKSGENSRSGPEAQLVS